MTDHITENPMIKIKVGALAIIGATLAMADTSDMGDLGTPLHITSGLAFLLIAGCTIFDSVELHQRAIGCFGNPLRSGSAAAKIAHAQQVMDRLNNRFHDAMQEAQLSFSDGMPMKILALFHGVQVGLISRCHPEFRDMVISEIEKHCNKVLSPVTGEKP